MIRFEVSNELLKQFRESIGDYTPDKQMDKYYKNFLTMAMSDLITDDIDRKTLSVTELGKATTCLYAEALMNKTDIATNPTISLLRNKLALISKGEKYDVQQ